MGSLFLFTGQNTFTVNIVTSHGSSKGNKWVPHGNESLTVANPACGSMYLTDNHSDIPSLSTLG